MKFLLWLIIGVALFFVWVRYIERHNMYFPMKEINVAPDSIGLSYNDVNFASSDNTNLHGWFITSGNARFTILICHGNGGNISHRFEKIVLFHSLGLDVFIFDYRGYGRSEGRPSESGLYKDSVAAYNYLVENRKINKNKIVLYGESLGGAVAIYLASKVPVKALIMEEAFSSIRDMAKIVYPFVPSFIVSNKFDSVSNIKNVTCPKLFFHSVDDEIVPFYLGEKLFNAAPPPKKLLKVRGSHNTAFFDSEKQFKEGIKSFLDELS